MIYSIDFETRSVANLPDVGLDNYANDPTTEVLCIAFGTQPDNVVVHKGDSLWTNAVVEHVTYLKVAKYKRGTLCLSTQSGTAFVCQSMAGLSSN